MTFRENPHNPSTPEQMRTMSEQIREEVAREQATLERERHPVNRKKAARATQLRIAREGRRRARKAGAASARRNR